MKTPKEIKEIVCADYNITLAEMNSRKRPDRIAFPRQVAMFLVWEIPNDWSCSTVGECFKRDHVTVLHAFTTQ